MRIELLRWSGQGSLIVLAVVLLVRGLVRGLVRLPFVPAWVRNPLESGPASASLELLFYLAALVFFASGLLAVVAATRPGPKRGRAGRRVLTIQIPIWRPSGWDLE